MTPTRHEQVGGWQFGKTSDPIKLTDKSNSGLPGTKLSIIVICDSSAFLFLSPTMEVEDIMTMDNAGVRSGSCRTM